MRLDGLKIHSRGFADDVIVAGVEARVVADPPPEAVHRAKKMRVGMWSAGHGENHLSARVRPLPIFGAKDRTEFAEVGDPDLIAFVHKDAWRPLPFDHDTRLMAVIRRPRVFGDARATFLLQGSAPTRKLARLALEAVDAVWPQVWFRLLLLAALAGAGYAAYRGYETVRAFLADGLMTSIGGFQFLILGLVAAGLLHLPFRLLRHRMGALTTGLSAVLVVAGAHIGAPHAAERYAQVEPFIDPGGFFAETLGRPLERAIEGMRNVARPGAERAPKLAPDAIQDLRADLFAATLGAAFLLTLVGGAASARGRSIHAAYMLLWTGGGAVEAYLSPNRQPPQQGWRRVGGGDDNDDGGSTGRATPPPPPPPDEAFDEEPVRRPTLGDGRIQGI